MRKAVALALAISATCFAAVTGTSTCGGSPRIAAITSDVCGEKPYAMCTMFCASNWNFTINPPSGCSFDPDSEYYVTSSKPYINMGTMDAYHRPGDPIALFGPFFIVGGNYACGNVTEITSGGFSGIISGTLESGIPISEVKLYIQHHYLGQNITAGTPIDYFGADSVRTFSSTTDLGGGNYRYTRTGFSSGAKRVIFFWDMNSNNTMDAGEVIDTARGREGLPRDVGIVGHQNDDSVNVDLHHYKINEQLRALPVASNIRLAPNPFNSTLAIHVENPAAGVAGDEIQIFDMRGEMVKTLAAASTVIWDGTDKNNVDLPTGIYFVRLASNHKTHQKAWLIR